MSTVTPIERVAVIVTDPSADANEVERIERAGVEIVTVVPETHPVTAGTVAENGATAPGVG